MVVAHFYLLNCYYDSIRSNRECLGENGMKLSKKGFEKLLDSCQFDEDRATYALNFSNPKKDYYFEIQETEFEPDDFQGAVVLTVEEANHINNVINQLFLSINKANIHLTQEQANALIEFQYQVEGCE